jgi:transposase
METMSYYAGIDLHSNNLWLSVLDEEGRAVFEKRLPNDVGVVDASLSRWAGELESVVVESTYNWYWLVDGLEQAGYSVELAHANAARPYEGIKHRDDRRDANWLAELRRLRLLPTGYICPRPWREVRGLLRKRAQLVRQQTAQLLSLGMTWQREWGTRLSRRALKELTAERVAAAWQARPLVGLAVEAGWEVACCLQRQIRRLEQAVLAQLKDSPTVRLLQTIPGIGPILSWTIYLETGRIDRFERVGDYASYCRCVNSAAFSNGKKKGAGNRKNGNVYLKWAYQEAAVHALRVDSAARRFYERKKRQRNAPVAHAALAHKRCRAAYWIQRNGVRYDPARQFA